MRRGRQPSHTRNPGTPRTSNKGTRCSSGTKTIIMIINGKSDTTVSDQHLFGVVWCDLGAVLSSVAVTARIVRDTVEVTAREGKKGFFCVFGPCVFCTRIFPITTRTPFHEHINKLTTAFNGEKKVPCGKTNFLSDCLMYSV